MVWKKTEDHNHPEPAPPPPRPPQAPSFEPQRRPERGTATIGPSIFIQGDLSGEEDLVIDGKVEGKIDLRQNNVTVGKHGRVHADIYGKVVIIEGEIDGNVFAQEQLILRQSGAVHGNLTAPRVVLEDGSRFRGSIDMEPKDSAKPVSGADRSAPASQGGHAGPSTPPAGPPASQDAAAKAVGPAAPGRANG